MVKNKLFTVEFVAKALLKRGVISEEQCKNIILKGSDQKARLQKLQDTAHPRHLHRQQCPILPAEVISSFNIEIHGKEGRILTEDAITQVIADETGVEYRKIDPLKLNLDIVTSYVSRPFAMRYLVVPVDEKDGIVTLAIADPFNLEPVESLGNARKIKVKIVLSSKSDIVKIVREFFGFRMSVEGAEAEASSIFELGSLEQYVNLKGQGEIEATDQHIINAVEYLLHYAFDQRASDIHIEPKKEKAFVRLRIDGILHYIHTIPKVIHAPIISRIKMLSRMDIAEKRRPQDGRIKTNYNGKDIEIRVSTLPVAFGEKVVIRIFDPEVLLQDIDHLGFYPREFQLYNSFIRRPNGVILVTGPTGSGKTTTLYSTLRALASPDVNIITIEEPIEMIVEEFNQVGVQPAINVTFANILRTILRQDPDIIMVGEIRDKETAENAVQSALTGHLVLSTLHTNDAPSSVTRLLDIGVPAFLLSSTIIGIVAQRLVRKICPYCKKEGALTEEEIDHLQLVKKPYKIYYGEGCLECRGTGYRGRTGIFEVMEFTDKLKRLLNDKAGLSTIYDAAKADGMVNLRQTAIKKMLEGITTYEEVISVTG
ncbi:MAG: type II secretion system protein E [Nitrospirae bacterium GWF2_44_13]|nr:MAG: type II secretion system protein E [Nitrospirae bacterium GWF2_44_13]HBG92475.1 type II secretion system protein E [Nitrospiraceae bacterium]